jgi:hypothetical protein
VRAAGRDKLREEMTQGTSHSNRPREADRGGFFSLFSRNYHQFKYDRYRADILRMLLSVDTVSNESVWSLHHGTGLLQKSKNHA